MKQRWLVLFALFAIFFSSFLYALDPTKSIHQYVHRKWTQDNGLPGHTVTAILQSRNGALWIATASGLFRFDGITFSEIPTNPINPNSHEWITALFESRDGTLWIGTAFKGLRALKNGKLVAYGLKEGFEDTQVWQITEDSDGALYVATSIGLYGVRGGKFLKLFDQPNYISSVVCGSDGYLYLGTHQGVFVLDGVKKIMHLSTDNGLPNSSINRLYFDAENTLWIGTANGLVRYKEKTIKTYSTADGLAGNFITGILKDRHHNIWVSTQRGVSRYALGKWTSFTEEDGLTNDNVLTLAEDAEGSIWLGTSGGLNQFYSGNAITFTTHEGLANNHISSIVETPDGSLYFLSPEGTSITRFFRNTREIYPTSVGPVYVARDGSIWMGQSGFLMNIKNGTLKKYGTESGIPQRWISAITEDSLSLVLYVDHVGLFRFINGTLKPYFLNKGKQYPADEYIVCLYYQNDGTLWIGAANGLVQIRGGEMKWFTQKDGLAGTWVSSITEDRQGNIWIASPQGGITRYYQGKFTKYSSAQGLSIDEIYSIVCDDENNIWMGTPRGIQVVYFADINAYAKKEIPQLRPRFFTTADGLKSNECFGAWQPAAWKTKSGNIWFATKNGAVKIVPSNVIKNTALPLLSIEKIVAEQNDVAIQGSVVLPAGTNSLEIHYAAYVYVIPERVFFQYKLQGYDDEWREVAGRRVAYYTNLPPGEYQFLVKACNNEGVWNETPTTIRITIEPFFYQTWWFHVFVLLTITGMIVGFVRYRVWQHKKREQELEIRISEALANIKILSGLIPICSNCKKIRDDSGYWAQLESYIQSHADVKFSHGICPECAAKLYPQYGEKKNTEHKLPSDNSKPGTSYEKK